jgi:D-alanine-D-alanine ligase
MVNVMERKRVAVIMGGMSTEHDVSLRSGAQVLEALKETPHEVKPVIIEKNGTWKIDRGFTYTLEDLEKIAAVPLSSGISIMAEDAVDVCFLALHGQYGEDGTLQGLLEMAGIAYTGSGVLGSALAMDKLRARQIMEYFGMSVPLTLAYMARDLESRNESLAEEIVQVLKLPVVIKPPCGGSSVGTFVVDKKENVLAVLKKGFAFASTLLVEEFIKGTEVTCGVLEEIGKHTPTPMPPTEIRPVGHKFFDYEAKYNGASEEITPAPVGESLTLEIQRIAVAAHLALDLSGFSRTDMIIRDGKIYVLETNTIPGLTRQSLFPQAAKVAGHSFSSLVECLIAKGLEAHAGRAPCRSAAL